jgi:hypothetical protein
LFARNEVFCYLNGETKIENFNVSPIGKSNFLYPYEIDITPIEIIDNNYVDCDYVDDYFE